MSAMNEYLPVLIVGGIIGAFTIVFLLAYAALRKETDRPDKERNIGRVLCWCFSSCCFPLCMIWCPR